MAVWEIFVLDKGHCHPSNAAFKSMQISLLALLLAGCVGDWEQSI